MRRSVWATGAALAAIGGWLATRSKSLTKNANPYVHNAVNRAKGLTYRAMRRHPSTTVDDSVLADRIRSTIGPLEKQLGLSRINVMVEDGIAILHGDIDSDDAALQIEDSVVASLASAACVRTCPTEADRGRAPDSASASMGGPVSACTGPARHTSRVNRPGSDGGSQTSEG
jgi:osmotically-inducible protein OsmY